MPDSAPNAPTTPLRPLIVFGTRPEAIKLAPVVLECFRRPQEISPIVCSTGQHREMLDQVLGYFAIRPDIDLGLMQPGRTLAGIAAGCLRTIDEVIVARESRLRGRPRGHHHGHGHRDGGVFPQGPVGSRRSRPENRGPDGSLAQRSSIAGSPAS